MLDNFYQRGFLPSQDPAKQFERHNNYTFLDDLGRNLPSWLLQKEFRQFARQLSIPTWQAPLTDELDLAECRLYYLRLGFLISGYINQIGQPSCKTLPANLSIPFCQVCDLLARPPILSYDGYALYNWLRLDQAGPIALGNIETLQNFVHLYDEHWFILVHVEIEAKAADILAAINDLMTNPLTPGWVDRSLHNIADSLQSLISCLKRIPEFMSAELYFDHFRPYIRFFEQVHYEGVNNKTISFRGETGAQSSIIPTLEALLKIPHQQSELTQHLTVMRQYMPVRHRQFIEDTAQISHLKSLADTKIFNQVLEYIAQFREIHYNWAIQYIADHTDDDKGTGGTPFMRWLKQLIDETRAYQDK
ncbi:MAG: hypothetical protein V3T17_14215 [Pseudomonadales bacterium]